MDFSRSLLGHEKRGGGFGRKAAPAGDEKKSLSNSFVPNGTVCSMFFVL